VKTSKNKTKFVILGLLSEEPLTGYEIKKIVDTRFGFFWSESFGQIYPELKRLEGEGLIIGNELLANENQSGKASKKYKITEIGRGDLRKWLAEPVEKIAVRYEILLKMYFSNNTTPEVILNHIREFQIIHKKQQFIFDRIEDELRGNIDLHENHQAILTVLSLGQKLEVSYVDWSNEVINLLEGKLKNS